MKKVTVVAATALEEGMVEQGAGSMAAQREQETAEGGVASNAHR